MQNTPALKFSMDGTWIAWINLGSLNQFFDFNFVTLTFRGDVIRHRVTRRGLQPSMKSMFNPSPSMQKAQALRFSMDETWIEKDGMDKS